jgi:hypothetical protein
MRERSFSESEQNRRESNLNLSPTTDSGFSFCHSRLRIAIWIEQTFGHFLKYNAPCNSIQWHDVTSPTPTSWSLLFLQFRPSPQADFLHSLFPISSRPMFKLSIVSLFFHPDRLLRSFHFSQIWTAFSLPLKPEFNYRWAQLYFSITSPYISLPIVQQPQWIPVQSPNVILFLRQRH